jgi:hypothetical protein
VVLAAAVLAGEAGLVRAGGNKQETEETEE